MTPVQPGGSTSDQVRALDNDGDETALPASATTGLAGTIGPGRHRTAATKPDPQTCLLAHIIAYLRQNPAQLSFQTVFTVGACELGERSDLQTYFADDGDATAHNHPRRSAVKLPASRQG